MILLASYFKERMFGQLQTDTQIIATVWASCWKSFALVSYFVVIYHTIHFIGCMFGRPLILIQTENQAQRPPNCLELLLGIAEFLMVPLTLCIISPTVYNPENSFWDDFDFSGDFESDFD